MYALHFIAHLVCATVIWSITYLARPQDRDSPHGQRTIPPQQGLKVGQQINLRMGNNKFLHANPNPNPNFDAQADVAGDLERFTLERTTVPNTFAIRAAYGKLLCWTGNHMETRDVVGDWERYEFQEIAPNQYYLYSPAHRVYINSINGLLISTPNRTEAGAVSINVVGGGGGQPAPPQQLQAGQQINLRMGNNKFLRAIPNFDAQADVAGNWERFTLERTTVPNTVAIRSAYGKLLCWTGNDMDTRDVVGDWERYEFQEIAPDQYYIYSPAHRVYINSINGFLFSSPNREEAGAVSINVVGDPQQQVLKAGQQINLRMGNSKFLHANPNPDFDAQADVAGYWERFTLVRTTMVNTFALRSAHGKLLSWVGNNMVPRDVLGDSERYEFQEIGPNQYYIYAPAYRVYINSINGLLISTPNRKEAGAVSVNVVGDPQQQVLQAGQQINLRMGNNKFLHANPNPIFDAQADVAGDLERFTLERTTVVNTFALRAAHGKLLCWNGNEMDTRDAVGVWERFEFQKIAANQYYIYSAAHRVYLNSVDGFIQSFSDRNQAQPVSIIVVGR